MSTRFSLGFLLGVVTVCCFLSWLIATGSGPAILGYLAVCTTLSALLGHSRRSSPIAYGMAGGAAACLVMLLGEFIKLNFLASVGSSWHKEELVELYQEIEAVPPGILLWVAIGATTGLFCGMAVEGLLARRTRGGSPRQKRRDVDVFEEEKRVIVVEAKPK